MKIKTPTKLEQATALLERHAELADQVARAEARRTRIAARANAVADRIVAPLLEEQALLQAALEPWWKAAGPELAKGKKSMQLGGCNVGTRASAEKLAHSHADDEAATAKLLSSPYRRQTTVTKFSLDRGATLKLLQLGGKTGEALGKLGFSIASSVDVFFVKRAEQAGTIA